MIPTILGLLSVVCLLVGIGACTVSRGAISDASAYVWTISGVLFWVASAITEEIRKLRRELRERAPPR